MLNGPLLNTKKSFVFFVFSLFFFTLTFSSCKKKDSLLGGKAYNQADLLSSSGVDTFQLITYTIESDSLLTKSPSRTMLGILNDRDFGVTDASFYTQVRLSGVSPNFGDVSSIVIDSFILALEYTGGYGYYGKQTFEVYELDEAMSKDSAYYGDKDLNVKSTNLVSGSGELTVNPSALTIVGNDTVASQLRIPLSNAKALQIIQDASVFTADFANNDLFAKNYFKGIHVRTNGQVPVEKSGMVGYFNLTDVDTKLIIYYKQDGVVKSPFNMVINSECAYYNRMKVANNGKHIAQVVADSTLGQQTFYAQAGRYRGVIGFPTLKNISKNSVVHAAKLMLPIQSLPGSKFTFPSQLSLLIKDKPSQEIVATYDPYIKGYVADLRTYVQAYLIGNFTENELTISPRSFISSAERVMFNGQNTINKIKPKLVVTYTNF